MKNSYLPVSVSAKSEYGDGPVELDLSVMEEQDALAGGHLVIAPRKYRVLSDNYTAAPQGEMFEGAFPIENEAALIQGGHIERVVDKPTEGTNEPSGDQPDAPPAEDTKPAAKAPKR